MSTKELILQALEQATAEQLEEVWVSIQHIQQPTKTPSATDRSEVFWQAYLESEQEYEEVYQRLANS
jgi:hypothetical protein